MVGETLRESVKIPSVWLTSFLDFWKVKVISPFDEHMFFQYALELLNLFLVTELGYSKKATEQMDVYSFGVVLLELVTGRQVEQAEPADSLDIVKWVRRKINITNGAIQVLDSKISNTFQQEMLGALDIAIRCTSVMPEKRPSMVEVVRELVSLSSKAQLPCSDFSMQEENSVPV